MDYAIGSERYPGLGKIVEEGGELLQVLGKLVATGGNSGYFDGTDLNDKLVEKVADLYAALDFFVYANNNIDIGTRRSTKFLQFVEWHFAVEEKQT